MSGEIKDEDLNPITEVRKREGDSLVIERTHEKPMKFVESHNGNGL